VVHVPSSVAVTSYQFTGSNQVARSLFVVADQPPGRYAVNTLVSDPMTVAVYPALVAKNTALGCGTDQESGAANSVVTTTAALTGSC
jgi:hypothetical protein